MIEILGVRYMSEKEASSRYGYSVTWFQKQRSMKKPPPYVKLRGKGRIYYHLEETDQWFRDNMIRIED